MFLFDKDHNLAGFYNKKKLVPFGEYVPFPFKIFSKMFPYLEGYDFKSGNKTNLLIYKDFRIAPLICFEAIFPNFVSNFILKNGNLLINITNDAWFGNSSAPFQHFEMARIRAIETGKYLVRAANTGISAIISPDGEIIKLSHLFKKEIIIGEISLTNNNTLWIKYKNQIFILFLTLFGIIFILVEKNRK